MPALEEVDEALWYAALSPDRGPAWSRFVDSLLDERLRLAALEPRRSPEEFSGTET